MKCPECGEYMEFEEAKRGYGAFYCGECDSLFEGSRLPISDGDGLIEYEERIIT